MNNCMWDPPKDLPSSAGGISRTFKVTTVCESEHLQQLAEFSWLPTQQADLLRAGQVP